MFTIYDIYVLPTAATRTIYDIYVLPLSPLARSLWVRQGSFDIARILETVPVPRPGRQVCAPIPAVSLL